VEIGQSGRELFHLAETVFLTHFGYHCIGATETSNVTLATNTLQLVQALSKSISKEGQFTLVAERFFRRDIDLPLNRAALASNVALAGQSLQASASLVEIGH
jgi:hypothetical protein